MAGKILTVEMLAETIKDMFATYPKSKLAFTCREIAEAIWEDPTILEEGTVRELLMCARHVLEDNEKDSFIPVTDYYFRIFDDGHQPRNDLDAKRSIAGYGRGNRTCGIRRLRSKYLGANDRLSMRWIELLEMAATATIKRFSGRVLIGFNKNAITREYASGRLKNATLLVLPDDRATLRKLLPRGVKIDGIKIQLTGKGKSLKDLRVSKDNGK
jgi:hypothetical protein